MIACRKFEKLHGREPTQAEKEVLRPLYKRYKEVKARVEGVSAPASGPAVLVQEVSAAIAPSPIQAQPEHTYAASTRSTTDVYSSTPIENNVSYCFRGCCTDDISCQCASIHR